MAASPAAIERELPETVQAPPLVLPRAIDALGSDVFDVVVVGGGMHGAWIAWRTAAAGLRTALVERGDFGAATSANSLKVLHGGLRYLQHLDVRRMRASIRARREFARLAPDLVRPLPCVMPLAGTGLKSPWVMGPALAMNDFLARDRNLGVEAAAHLPRGRIVGAAHCRALVEPLTALEPFAGALWWDALALDTQSLTLEPLRAAIAAGAVVVRRADARGLRVRGGVVRGVVVRDELGEGNGDDDVDVNARVVVDASGPWAGRLAGRAGLPVGYLPKGWVGALNLVLNRSLGIDTAVALPAVARAADASAVVSRKSRELFFVPWNGVTMVGTEYRALKPTTGGFAPEDTAASREDVAAFVAEIARVAPRARITVDDVEHVHWGVLPGESLGGLVPCKSAIIASSPRITGAKGLVVAIGDKLTSAPVVSERVLQRVTALVAEARRSPPKRHRRRYSGGGY